MAAAFIALLEDDVVAEEGALPCEELLDFEGEDEERAELRLDAEELTNELADDFAEELLGCELLLELLDALEDDGDEDFELELELELDCGVTTTTELAEDATEDLLDGAALLAKLELDTTDERDEELELRLEFELGAKELLLATELNEELATEVVGDGWVDPPPSPPPPPPQAVITKVTPITKLALIAKRISHPPLILIFK